MKRISREGGDGVVVGSGEQGAELGFSGEHQDTIEHGFKRMSRIIRIFENARIRCSDCRTREATQSVFVPFGSTALESFGFSGLVKPYVLTGSMTFLKNVIREDPFHPLYPCSIVVVVVIGFSRTNHKNLPMPIHHQQQPPSPTTTSTPTATSQAFRAFHHWFFLTAPYAQRFATTHVNSRWKYSFIL